MLKQQMMLLNTTSRKTETELRKSGSQWLLVYAVDNCVDLQQIFLFENEPQISA